MPSLRRSTRNAVLVALLCVAPALGAAPRAPAQWQVQSLPVAGAGAGKPVRVATMRNASGDRLLIYRDQDEFVRMTFQLGPGFDRLRPGGCPTYVVDTQPAAALAEGDGCKVEARSASAKLGQVQGGEIRSSLLTQLVNGEKITLRYAVTGRGYRASSFSLRGSMQAVSQIIGSDVQVVAP